MKQTNPFPKCDACENRFSADDKRSFVYGNHSICPLCRALDHGRTRWIVTNDCNGPFEDFEHRKDALAALAKYEPDCECYVAPAVLIYQAVDSYRAMHMGWNENEREGIAPFAEIEHVRRPSISTAR